MSKPNLEEEVSESVNVTTTWDMGRRILYIGNFLPDFTASRYGIFIRLKILILAY